MSMNYRVALASSDGKNIDLHFAQAHTFYIYDLSEKGCAFVEKRSAFEFQGHSEAQFDRATQLLKDCKAVFVSHIGPAAARYLLLKGVRVLEAPYSIEAVLQKFRAAELKESDNE